MVGAILRRRADRGAARTVTCRTGAPAPGVIAVTVGRPRLPLPDAGSTGTDPCQRTDPVFGSQDGQIDLPTGGIMKAFVEICSLAMVVLTMVVGVCAVVNAVRISRQRNDGAGLAGHPGKR